MEPADLPGADPNALPYFIIEAQTSRRVPVRFAPLMSEDAAELGNEDWANAVFTDVWRQLIGEASTFKLVRTSAEDGRIQGLVRVGSLAAPGGLLEESLLESAPFNQHNQAEQAYRGVGRVLVARLVVESVLQRGKGRVGVSARPGSEAFYRSLGFRQNKFFRLSADDLQTLLLRTLLFATGNTEKVEDTR